MKNKKNSQSNRSPLYPPKGLVVNITYEPDIKRCVEALRIVLDYVSS